MARRIESHVLSGEIDNRVRGRVTGILWIAGCDVPVRLELDGDALPDLAGRVLAFRRNSPARSGLRLAEVQRGEAGDLTASRRVRVCGVPTEGLPTDLRGGDPCPEGLANVLYLEWFSESDGRVVLEATGFETAVSEPFWAPVPSEVADLRRRAGEAFERYVDRLTREVERLDHPMPKRFEDWNEFDFERVLRQSDARTDKLGELIDKFGEDPDGEERIARAMGWTWVVGTDEAGTAATDGSCADDRDPEDDLSEPDPLTEGIDWVRTAADEISHPLVERCSEGAIRLWREQTVGDRPCSDDPALHTLLAEYQITTAKLAGALNGLAYGRDTQHPAFVVACLKRALVHLHSALGAAGEVRSRRLLQEPVAARVTSELFGIRESILGLMSEFRRSQA